jgi:hypothetical protein
MTADEDAIRNTVREIVRRALIDLKIDAPPDTSPSSYFAPWTGVEYEAHPSRHQFDVSEATMNSASVPAASEILEFVETKLCTIEKNRACDHCGMCRSLGF